MPPPPRKRQHKADESEISKSVGLFYKMMLSFVVCLFDTPSMCSLRFSTAGCFICFSAFAQLLGIFTAQHSKSNRQPTDCPHSSWLQKNKAKNLRLVDL